MQKAQTRVGAPCVWNTSGTLYTYLASRHDAHFNYATVNVRRMIKEGLIPLTFETFDKLFDQGDVFLLQLNGQVNVMAKINRANKSTMAFHCPRIVQMPVWDIDGSDVVEQKAIMLGYTGIRLSKDESLRDLGGRPVTAKTPPIIPLAPHLETPSNHRVEGSICVHKIESITQEGNMLHIEYIK
jgi:hypothetical protein